MLWPGQRTWGTWAPRGLSQLRFCASKLNFSPGMQGGWFQHLLQVSVWEQQRKQRFKVFHTGFMWKSQLLCWSWLCSTCPVPCPARSSSSLHNVLLHLVFIAHNNLLIPWPFLNPNFPDPKSNFLQIISLEKSECIPIKNTDRSHCQLLKAQQSLLQHADSGTS